MGKQLSGIDLGRPSEGASITEQLLGSGTTSGVSKHKVSPAAALRHTCLQTLTFKHKPGEVIDSQLAMLV